MAMFDLLTKPPLSPPGWLFPLVWTILYTLMGLASYLVFTSQKDRNEIKLALQIYTLQLAFNFFWTILFFNFELYFFAFFWLLALLALIILTTILFYKVSKPAAYLMIPYIIWVTFAAYLNLGIALLNWKSQVWRPLHDNPNRQSRVNVWASLYFPKRLPFRWTA